MTVRVVLAEGNEALRARYAAALERHGMYVRRAATGAGAIRALERSDADVLVADLDSDDATCREVLGAAQQHDADLPVILLTSRPDLETAMDAVNHGAFRYLVKPVESEELEQVVHRAALFGSLARLRHEAHRVRDAADEERRELVGRFERAMKRSWMAYQPIVAARGGALLGYEALLRVDADGFSSPVEFFAAAETIDRVRDLSRTVRARVAEDARRLPTAANLFVNLHPTDLLDGDLYDARAPLSAIAARVVLELTERSSIEGVADLGQRIANLRALGYRIALDDLGAGYSGLSSLTLLEPEVVKLDRSLTHDVHRSASRQAVVRSVVALCRSLDIEVIGEGVEREAEAEMLRQLDVGQLQGFHIASPARVRGPLQAQLH